VSGLEAARAALVRLRGLPVALQGRRVVFAMVVRPAVVVIMMINIALDLITEPLAEVTKHSKDTREEEKESLDALHGF
jgi:hypothetical protein